MGPEGSLGAPRGPSSNVPMCCLVGKPDILIRELKEPFEKVKYKKRGETLMTCYAVPILVSERKPANLSEMRKRLLPVLVEINLK